jgi:hypothetical protein
MSSRLFFERPPGRIRRPFSLCGKRVSFSREY